MNHLALAAAKANEIAAEVQDNVLARDGIIQAGTYDPATGTVTVIQGDTVAVLSDDGQLPLSHFGVPLLTPPGDQYGPTGDQRCILIATQSGFVAIPHHGPDDSPQAPVGERWLTGATRYRFVTKGGLEAKLDDTAQKVTITAGSVVVTIDAGANTVSITANTVSLGGTGLSQTQNGAVRQSDLQTAMSAFKSAMVAAGVTNAGAIQVPTATSSSAVLQK